MSSEIFTLIIGINVVEIKHVITKTSITATCASATEILDRTFFTLTHIFYIVSGSTTLTFCISTFSKFFRVSLATSGALVTFSDRSI